MEKGFCDLPRAGTEQKPPTSPAHKTLHHRRCVPGSCFSSVVITHLLLALEKFQRQKANEAQVTWKTSTLAQILKGWLTCKINTQLPPLHLQNAFQGGCEGGAA